jgi:hypothetical protein
MRVISLIVVLGFTLVSPVVVRAQGRVAPPFSKLFRPTPPLLKPSTPPPAANVLNRPSLPARPSVKIVCGMTLMPVDSSLDPKIERRVPSTGTTFTLRTVKPPVCGQ